MDDSTRPHADPGASPAISLGSAPAVAPLAPTSTATGGSTRSSRRAQVKSAFRIAFWLVALIACILVYGRMTRYGAKVVQAHPVDARIEIANPPPWLDRRIVNALLDESYHFAGQDATTYDRARDLLDSGILKEIANLYTGTSTVDGNTISNQTLGYNAWISRVTQVRRVVARGEELQTIQITADWRQPAAWIRVQKNGEPMLYLMDADGTRLPGEYRLADRGNSPLMVLTGLDLPKISGTDDLPAPGQKWFVDGNSMGQDLAAGMQLMDLLRRHKFAAQIAAIDLSNFSGRQDDHAPWIVLETIFPAANGTPRVVQWGRPIGQEKYYEVQAAAKLKTLKDLYARFNRIDAGRDYVDIRSEVVRLPKVAIQSTAQPLQRG